MDHGARHDEVKCSCGRLVSKRALEQHKLTHPDHRAKQIEALYGNGKHDEPKKKLTLRDITPGHSIW